MAPSLLLERPGDDADVGDAGLLDRVHDGGEGAEGHTLVGAQVDDALGGSRLPVVLSREGSSLTLTGLSCRKTFWSLSMVTTMRSSVSWLTVRVLGMATSTPDCSTGAVSMKMSSSTSTTSTSGVMLISASAVWVRPLAEKAMARRSSGARSSGCGGAVRGHHGGVLDCVEQFAAEVVHARAELAQARGELVVADDGGDSDDEAGGGGDEGLGDAGGDGAQGRCARGAEAVEGVDDAHDGAEEADEERDGGDGGEPGHAALHRGEGFAGCGLGGALECDGIARKTAAAVLALVLVVDLGEDGDQRAGLELIGDCGDLAQPARFAEGAEEALALRLGSAEAGPLGEHDGPGEDARSAEE